MYVLHPPGGIVGGDELRLELRAGDGARALVTTPAATKIYRSAGPTSRLTQSVRVATNGVLEWLPLETILYAGARARAETRVELARGSHFVGWDITCLGHDALGFPRGDFVQRWRLEREGQLLWSERVQLAGGSPLLDAAWGLAGRPVVGTLVGTGARAEHVERLRAATPQSDAHWSSVTRLGEVLICRYLGYSAEVAKSFLGAAWGVLREGVSGRRAHQPRVWAT